MNNKRFFILASVLLTLLSGSACRALEGAGQPVSSTSERLVSIELFLPADSYSQAAQRRSFVQQLIKQIKTLPEVRSVAAVSSLPDSPSQKSKPVLIEGASAAVEGFAYTAVSPDYAATVRMALLAGRFFTEEDGPSRPGVVVLSQSAARSLFPDADAIGKRLSFSPTREKDSWLTVVGVAADNPDKPAMARAELYAPYNQDPTETVSLSVRADPKSPTLVDKLKNTIAAVDASVSIIKVSSS
jgi:hypothetical protein